MKFKMAVPRDVLTVHQIGLIEGNLADGLFEVVKRNFPNWRDRPANTVSGGEIILQDTDMTSPIPGLKPGIHVTISLISFMEGRDFDGLASDTIKLIKQTRNQQGEYFMQAIGVFVQMSLDVSVVRVGTGKAFHASGDGRNLLEYSG